MMNGRKVLPTRREALTRIPHMFACLRHLSALALITVSMEGKPVAGDRMQRICLPPLQRFDQLRSLTLQLGDVAKKEMKLLPPLLVTTLDSLRQLRCLELLDSDWLDSEALRVSLHRLCSQQLLHVGLTQDWLKRLTRQDCTASIRRPPMPSIQSFRCLSGADSYLDLLAAFPSLTHAAVTFGGLFDKSVQLSPLPSLSSLRIDPWLMEGIPLLAHAEQLSTLIVSSSNRGEGNHVRELISHTRVLQQFAAVAPAGRTAKRFGDDIFRALERPFAALSYLQLDGALRAANWRYLLTPVRPPAFAVTLTHLSVRCHSEDLALAASLLPNLPRMYRALQRCHVARGGEATNAAGHRGRVQRVSETDAGRWDAARWDAAVQTLGAALGGVWCDDAAGVVACRSDMVWRRQANVLYLDDGL